MPAVTCAPEHLPRPATSRNATAMLRPEPRRPAWSPAAIGLGMTECEVVSAPASRKMSRSAPMRRRARGHADLYDRRRPGIYRFSAGRLKAIERAPGAAARAAAEAQEKASRPRSRKPAARSRRSLSESAHWSRLRSAAPAASQSSSALRQCAGVFGARLGERRGLRRVAREQPAVGERRVELLDLAGEAWRPRPRPLRRAGAAARFGALLGGGLPDSPRLRGGLRRVRRGVGAASPRSDSTAADSRRGRRRTASPGRPATSQSRSAQASSRWRSCDTRITAPG